MFFIFKVANSVFNPNQSMTWCLRINYTSTRMTRGRHQFDLVRRSGKAESRSLLIVMFINVESIVYECEYIPLELNKFSTSWDFSAFWHSGWFCFFWQFRPLHHPIQIPGPDFWLDKLKVDALANSVFFYHPLLGTLCPLFFGNFFHGISLTKFGYRPWHVCYTITLQNSFASWSITCKASGLLSFV